MPVAAAVYGCSADIVSVAAVNRQSNVLDPRDVVIPTNEAYYWSIYQDAGNVRLCY